MDEELNNVIEVPDNEVIIDGGIKTEDLEQDITISETVDSIEIEPVEEIDVEVEEEIGWVGGDSTRHYSLYGRDEPNQHTIESITGLREELNDIEALDIVYSNKRNQANYYLWEDENILQENRIGYFVNVCSDIDKIKICTSDNDIFGVTVDDAGFIGAQSDITRDIKYGLVVTTGVVRVRCESSVDIGDYVVSNDYGCAQRNKNGYKVVGRHQINEVEYAEITLITPINRICKLSDDVENVNTRMNSAERNIVSAINVSNAAYNKASEAANVSEEVLKDALEALRKSEDSEAEIDKFLDETAPDITEIWKEAQAIAESAAASASTTKDVAVATANEAWAKSDNVATEFQSLTAKIDQYSVGEYSQAYGLTLEQAASILKAGMLYVPTKHLDTNSHTEIYLYTDEDGKEQETSYSFTPGNHYEWNGSSWIEYGNTVAFFSEEPVSSDSLKYWYIDSNEAPEGYEAHALYINEDGQWTKVNILEGNVNNRMTSMIKQTTDRIALEVTNTRGSVATLENRITNTEATVENTAQWAKGKTSEGEELYNITTIKQTASEDGSSLALVVADTEGNKILKGANIILGQNEDDSYIQFNANSINLKGSTINLTSDDITIASDKFNVDKNGNIEAAGGNIGGWTITSDFIGKHEAGMSSAEEIFISQGGQSAYVKTIDPNPNDNNIGEYYKRCVLYVTNNFAVDTSGNLYANNATLKGNITATSGKVANWTIDGDYMSAGQDDNNKVFLHKPSAWGDTAASGGNKDVLVVKSKGTYPFVLLSDGSLSASKATITGTINASSGNFANGVTIGNTSITAGNLRQMYRASQGYTSDALQIKRIEAESGKIGSWNIDKTDLNGSYAVSGVTYNVEMSPGTVGYSMSTGPNKTTSWYAIIESATGSDQRLKNNIEDIDLRYELLFDSLQPKTFYYNPDAQCGNPNNIHFGFIAQDILNTQKNINIDNLSFILEEKYYGIKMNEFIALNTWQIQKAKARITELENKVAELEKIIKGE